MTHASRALQSHDLSGEGINLWITYIFFWSHKDMEGMGGSPGDVSENPVT